jgi:hypothetical protein
MTDYSDQSASLSSASHGIATTRRWISEAWQVFLRDPLLWIGLAVIYFLAAILLKRIPFMGNLVLVLLTPIPLAGMLLLARTLTESPGTPPALPAGWRERLGFFVQRPLTVFGSALKEEGFGFPLALICIVVLGLTMVVIIVEIMLAGGSALSGITGTRYSAGPLRITTQIGIGVALVLYSLLVMTLFHLIPLVLFRRELVVSALVESLRAWRRAPLPLALYLLLFLVPYALIAITFARSATHWLGYLLVFSAGTVLLPLFVIGIYLSYHTLHGKTPAAGVRS